MFDPQILLIGGPRGGTKKKALVPSFQDWLNIAAVWRWGRERRIFNQYNKDKIKYHKNTIEI